MLAVMMAKESTKLKMLALPVAKESTKLKMMAVKTWVTHGQR